MTGITHYNPSDPLIRGLWLPVFATLVAVVLWAGNPDFGYAASGGSGRWLTAFAGQFAHIDTRHLLLNLAGLYLVCWGFMPWRTPVRDGLFLLAGVSGVMAGLLLSPQIAWYRGLSGALHGLFCAYVLCIMVLEPRGGVRAVALVLLAGACIKLLIEDPTVVEHLTYASGLRSCDAAPCRWLLDGWMGQTGSGDAAQTRVALLGTVKADIPVLYESHRWGAAAGAVIGGMTGAWLRLARTRITSRS